MENVKKEIIINSSVNETRVAIVENERLVEMYLERPENERTIGNIYAGFVENIIPGMNSLFVDIGETINGFCHLDEFNRTLIPDQFLAGDYEYTSLDKEIIPVKNKKDKKQLQSGNKVMVQVIKEQINSKGPRLTSQISIPGRYVVLMPNYRGVKISKKITKHSERRRLRRLVANLLPDDFGIIVRTAAENKDADIFIRDIMNAYNLWKGIVKNFNKAEKPQLLYKDYDVSASIVRDLFNNDVERVIVDSKELYSSISDYVRNMAPELLERVSYYNSEEPIFDKFYNINRDYVISLSREVYLKKGGSIVIDHTEAMVAIDINSKKFVRNKKPQEENSLTINLSAAREIARQLRLRDLGGLIVIDFIDMLEQSNRDKVFQELRHHLKRDNAKISVEPISRFGLVEMTRQRLKPSLTQTVYENCPFCQGKGIVKSKETITVLIDRWLKNYKYASKLNEVDIKVSSELYEYLTSGLQNKLSSMQIKHWMKVNLYRDTQINPFIFKCYTPGTEKEVTEEYKIFQ